VSHPLEKLGVTLRNSFIIRWKARVDFIFAIIERFSLALTVVRAFQRKWVILTANFRWKGMSPPTIVVVRKLENLGHLTMKTAWSYLHWCRYNTRMQQTDWKRTYWRICRSYYNAVHCNLQAIWPRCKTLQFASACVSVCVSICAHSHGRIS